MKSIKINHSIAKKWEGLEKLKHKVFACVSKVLRNAQQFKTAKLRSYITIRISPHDVSYHIIEEDMTVEEKYLDLENIKEIPLQLLEFKKSPVHIVLKSWEQKIKHLNLENIGWIDRHYIKKEFQKGEFDKKDYVSCMQSSIQKNLYHFIAIPQSYVLDQSFLALLNIKNPIVSISLEEQIILNDIVDFLPPPTFAKNWRIIFFQEGKYWKIIVGHGKDLILTRLGTLSEKIEDASRYYVQEILDTLHYLPRLGAPKNEKIAIYAQKNVLLAEDICSLDLELIPFHNLEQERLLKPKERSIFSKIKEWFFLDFSNKSFKVHYFFWHKLLYNFPKYTTFFLTPPLLLISISCLVYGIKLEYFQSKNIKLDQIFQDTGPEKRTQNNKKMDIKKIALFKNYYQNNPIKVMRQVADSMQSIAAAQMVQWSIKDHRIKITLKISKTPYKKKKEHFIKQKIEHEISKNVPFLTPQWNDQNDEILTLTLVGPE